MMNPRHRSTFLPAASSSWSTEDIRKLRQLAEEGRSLSELCKALRRTESAIRNKASMHGIPLKNSRTAQAADA
jgi:hypothetical protein